MKPIALKPYKSTVGNSNRSRYYSATDDISYIPLTWEEEKALFARFYDNNDLAARDEIFSRHLKLAAKLSLHAAKGMLPEDDAISAGNFGLLQCLNSKNFDPNFQSLKPVRFSTYCRLYVTGQVKAALRFLSPLSLGKADTTRTVRAEDAATTGTGGYDGGFNASTVIEATLGTQEHGYEDKERQDNRMELISRLLAGLPTLEAEAVRGEFFHQHTFADTARRFGVSREGVRKAYNRAMIKLTKELATVDREALL